MIVKCFFYEISIKNTTFIKKFKRNKNVLKNQWVNKMFHCMQKTCDNFVCSKSINHIAQSTYLVHTCCVESSLTLETPSITISLSPDKYARPVLVYRFLSSDSFGHSVSSPSLHHQRSAQCLQIYASSFPPFTW